MSLCPANQRWGEGLGRFGTDCVEHTADTPILQWGVNLMSKWSQAIMVRKTYLMIPKSVLIEYIVQILPEIQTIQYIENNMTRKK